MQPISFNLIREDILPQVEEISVFSMIAEEARTMAFQMLNSYNNKPQVIQNGWKVMVELTTRTGSLYKEATVNSCENNNSIFIISLSSEDTKAIVAGKIIVWAIDTLLPDRLMIMEDISTLPTAAVDGVISLPDSVDLSDIRIGDYLEQQDGMSAERFTALILGINDVNGAKSITVRSDFVLNIAAESLMISRSSKIFKGMKDSVIKKAKARC